MGPMVLPFESPTFLKNPYFKKKNKTTKKNPSSVANCRLVLSGKIISSKVGISCQTKKATENIWNIFLGLQRWSLGFDLYLYELALRIKKRKESDL